MCSKLPSKKIKKSSWNAHKYTTTTKAKTNNKLCNYVTFEPKHGIAAFKHKMIPETEKT